MEGLILAMSLVCGLAPSAPLNGAGPKSVEAKAPVTKAEYVKKAHAELYELSAKVDALELKAKEAGAGMDKKLQELKSRRKTAQKDFSKLRHAGGKAWLSFKAAVDRGIQGLRAAYEETAKEVA